MRQYVDSVSQHFRAKLTDEPLERLESVGRRKRGLGTNRMRRYRIAAVLNELREGDALIVSELSRLGRCMLECMEILSIAAEHASKSMRSTLVRFGAGRNMEILTITS